MTGRRDDKGDAKEGGGRRRRRRGVIGRRLMRVGAIRRWYVRRTLRFIDRSKEKGRRLPEGLAETARYLSRVPKQRRAEALEEAIMTEQEMPNMGREYRRAAERKRLSTRSDTRYRPGRPPGSIKGPRPKG